MTRSTPLATRCLRPLLAALALHAGLAGAATDDKLLAAAREQQPAVIESLREMVLIESGTTDPAGLAKMTDYASAPARARWSRAASPAPASATFC